MLTRQILIGQQFLKPFFSLAEWEEFVSTQIYPETTYVNVKTKFSRIDKFPYFLSTGAPPRALRAEAPLLYTVLKEITTNTPRRAQHHRKGEKCTTDIALGNYAFRAQPSEQSWKKLANEKTDSECKIFSCVYFLNDATVQFL